MTKVVFMGTPDFSVPVLSMLSEEGYEILAAVTQPDRPVGRKRILTPPPVKEEAVRLSIPVLQPEKLSGSKEMEQILQMNPDIIITAAYGQILPKKLLNAPRLGCINVHASLLPKYRGGAPIHQSIIDGEKETGVTIMYMAEKLDAGDIISQVTVPITDEDHTGTMFAKLSAAGTQLLKETLPSIIDGTNKRIAQDAEQATFAGNITRDQERIDWKRTGRSIFNQIRGLYPFPGAFTVFLGENVKIWRAALVKTNKTAEPGTILKITKDELTVATGSGEAVSILELQPSGKKRMMVDVFLNGIGSKWSEGDRFE